MAALATQSIVSTGLKPTYAAAGGSGDTIAPVDGRTFVHIKNAGTLAGTVTVASTAVARSGLAQSNLVVAIPAGEDRMIAVDPTGFADNTGTAAITYAGGSVTVAAVRL